MKGGVKRAKKYAMKHNKMNVKKKRLYYSDYKPNPAYHTGKRGRSKGPSVGYGGGHGKKFVKKIGKTYGTAMKYIGPALTAAKIAAAVI